MSRIISHDFSLDGLGRTGFNITTRAWSLQVAGWAGPTRRIKPSEARVWKPLESEAKGGQSSSLRVYGLARTRPELRVRTGEREASIQFGLISRTQ